MANISITNVCNKRCSYCFANDTRDEYGNAYMDDDVYDKALGYLKRSGLHQVRLLGGEPTLHPDFINFVQKALAQDFDIMIFTNGLMSGGVLEFIASIPNNKLTVLLNTIHPAENNEKGASRQRDVMKKLGNRLIAGVNIYSPTQKMDYLLNLVNEFNLKKEIRIGISHSVLSRNNRYLHPKLYQEVGYNIVKFKLAAEKAGVTFGFDCGFVPCMIPENYFDLLSEELKKAGSCCHPIIDMLSDGTFISCYPLHNLKKIELNDRLNAEDVILEFDNALAPYRDVGIYPYCSSCPLFKKRCNGGCMSYRIQRFVS